MPKLTHTFVSKSSIIQQLLEPAVIAIVLCVVYVFIRTVSYFHHVRRARDLGGKPAPRKPHRLPLGVDNILEMTKADNSHKVPQEVMRIYESMKCDTFTQTFFGTDVVMTHDPKNIQAVLAKQFQDFELGDLRRNNFFPMLGLGIFTADGEAWEHSRAMLRPQFARQQISDLELEERHVQALLRHLPADSSGWTALHDLGPLFFRLTIDSATEFLFGQGIQSQTEALSESVTIGKNSSVKSLGAAFDSAMGVLGARARMSSLYWLYNPKSFRVDCQEIRNFADHCIELAMSQGQRETKDGNDRYIFLQELIKVMRDPDQIRSQLLNILVAGRDTTAGLLGWTIWSLARDDRVFIKLRGIILEEFGPYEAPKNMTFSGLKSCPYLQYVLNEILRLYPSVPINARYAVKNTSLPRGGGTDGQSPVYVKKGQEVCYSVYVMHRRKDIWGADANEFKPERWAGRKAGWEYLPFNGGPRLCLGQQFALTEAAYVLVRMMQKFDGIDRRGTSDEELHQYSVTSSPKNVFVKLHEAR